MARTVLLIRGAMGAPSNRKRQVVTLLTVTGLWLGACDLNPQPLPPEGANPARNDDGGAAFGSSSSGGGGLGSGSTGSSGSGSDASSGPPVNMPGDASALEAADGGTSADSGPAGPEAGDAAGDAAADGASDAATDAAGDAALDGEASDAGLDARGD